MEHNFEIWITTFVHMESNALLISHFRMTHPVMRDVPDKKGSIVFKVVVRGRVCLMIWFSAVLEFLLGIFCVILVIFLDAKNDTKYEEEKEDDGADADD